MRTLTYPLEMAGFRPYGTGRAAMQSGDTIYHAVLGGIGDRKDTFHVWVWSEREGGLTLIPLEEPPNNAPSFYTRDGRIVLTGVREIGPGQRIVVEHDIAAYVDPVAWAIYNANGAVAAGLRQVLNALTKENERLKGMVGG